MMARTLNELFSTESPAIYMIGAALIARLTQTACVHARAILLSLSNVHCTFPHRAPALRIMPTNRQQDSPSETLITSKATLRSKYFKAPWERLHHDDLHVLSGCRLLSNQRRDSPSRPIASQHQNVDANADIETQCLILYAVST